MPLHLDSITSEYDNTNILAWIFSRASISELGYASKTSNYYHLFKPLIDSISNHQVGRIVFTLMNNVAEKRFEVIDTDIVFENTQSAALLFDSLLEGSSDSNEYYDVELTNDPDCRMSVETVNRHMIEEDIEGTTRNVHLCAFPFMLSLYDSMDELNKALGFREPIKVKGTDIVVDGYSDKFVGTGGAFGAKKGETFSFIIGKIHDYRDVELQMDEERLSFVLANVITGAGIMPVPMGKDVFDLKKLHEGAYVAMKADVKADFADAYQKNIVTGSDGTQKQEIQEEKVSQTGFIEKIKKLFRK